MATTLATVIARAKLRYGLDSSTDDALLTNALFIAVANELLRQAARKGKAFREEFTLNLSGTVAKHTLSTRIRQVIEGTVRLDYDASGSYTSEPDLIDEQELRSAYGAVEENDAG